MTAGVLALVVAAAGCGSTATPDPKLPAVLRAVGVVRVTPAGDAPVGAVATGMSALGYQLGRAETGNWVASPASIAYAFAMARAGANGDTAAELDRAFGFPAAGLGDAFNAITRQLVTAETPPPVPKDKRKEGEVRPTALTLGNALFPQAGYPIGPDFLRTLAEQYGAGVYPVDFAQPSASEAVDAWVKQQTAGRITKLFDRLAPDAKLVLANTVYFRADWAHPFGEIPSTDAPFQRAGGPVTVRMMQLGAGLRYAAGPGWQAVELPYSDGKLAMRILLPTGSTTPNDLLAPAVMGAVTAGLTTKTVQLSLPAWDFATTVPLIDALRALGVQSAFDDRADFGGIHPGLYIDQAIHRANITVDEAGTEAAAATGISMRETAGMLPQVTMVADHPFAFAIVHTGTGVPVFVGRVADPSAHAT